VLGAARQAGRRRAVLLAVAVAVLFAVVAVLTKASVFRLAHGGVPHLLSTPTPYVLAVVALAATVGVSCRGAAGVGADHDCPGTLGGRDDRHCGAG